MTWWIIGAMVVVVLTIGVINAWVFERSQAKERQDLEVRFKGVVTDLYRLRQVIRGSENPEAELLEPFRLLDAQRFVLDKLICMLQGMVPHNRIKACEVALVEAEVQRLWSLYYATK